MLWGHGSETVRRNWICGHLISPFLHWLSGRGCIYYLISPFLHWLSGRGCIYCQCSSHLHVHLFYTDMYSTGFWKGGYIPWVPQRGLRGQSPSGESFQKLNFQKARIIMLHWVQDCTNALRNEAKRITSVCLKDVYKGMRFTRIQYIDVICKWLVFMTLMIACRLAPRVDLITIMGEICALVLFSCTSIHPEQMVGIISLGVIINFMIVP